MSMCIGCGGLHEYEDCPYRPVVAELRRAGVDINTWQARQMADGARMRSEDNE